MKKRLLLSLTFLTSTFWVAMAQVSFELDPQKKFASMVLSPQDYTNWIANDLFSSSTGRSDISKKVYQKFKDDFDFIFFVSNEPNVPEHFSYAGKFAGVSNSNRGIGIEAFDFTTTFGSAGKLKGVMHIPNRLGLQNGPTLHEFMHNWGNYALQTGNYTASEGTINNYSAHWGFTGGSNPGQLGGFNQSTLQTNVNGDPKRYSVKVFGANANGGNMVPFSQLELYLMGMIPASQVSSFDLFRDITSVTPVGDRLEFVAGTRETHNGTTVESKLGVRDPSHLTSQKDFKVLFVAVSGAPLTEVQRSQIHEQVSWFTTAANDNLQFYNFFEATGGKGTINISNLNGSLLTVGQLVLTSQNLGSPQLIGQNNAINWQTDISGNLKIDLYSDGVFRRTLSQATAASTGSLSWTPLATDLGRNYRIRLSSVSNSDLVDYSDLTFAIEYPKYKVSGKVTESDGTPIKNSTLLIGAPLTQDQSQPTSNATSDIGSMARFQSFRPSASTLAKVQLYLGKAAVASQEVYLDVLDSSGAILGKDTIFNREILTTGYASSLFFPPLNVQLGKKHWLRVSTNNTESPIKWYMTTSNSYLGGESDFGEAYDFRFITFTGTGSEVKTDANGYYEILVHNQWSGPIGLPNNYNTLYPVIPETRSIPLLSSNLPNQNFEIRSPIIVSGKVYSSINTPISEAVVRWGAPVLADQQQTQNSFSTYFLGTPGVGQTFVPTVNKLSQMQFLLSKSRVPTEPVVVEIKKAGQLLASQIIPPNAETNSAYWAVAPFIPSLTLVPGEEYTVTLSSAVFNLYNWHISSSDTYSRGVPVNTGRTNFDFCFITNYGEGGTVQTDEQGYYQFRLPRGWTGETIATSIGSTFYPLRYSDIHASLTNQDFKDGIRTGIDERELVSFGIKVYPNPATNILYIEETNTAEPLLLLEFSDATGNKIREISPQAAESHTLDLSDLKSGLYLLKLSTRSRTVTTKVIKK